MWDALITVGNIIIIPAVLTTALDRRAYVPRLTSGFSVIGLVAVMTGLLGAGLVLSPIVVGIIALLWLFIFFFRHRPQTTPLVRVDPGEAPGHPADAVSLPVAPTRASTLTADQPAGSVVRD